MKSNLSFGGLGRRRFAPERVVQLVLVLMLAATLVVWWQAWRGLHSELAVIFVDVGQGECIIVESPTGRSLLIDGGGRAESLAASEDIGRWVVLPALYRQGISRLDCIIATHSHEDHIGGLAEVVEQLPVGMILEVGEDYSNTAYEEFHRAAERHGVPIVEAQAGQVFNLGAEIRAEVLHPSQPFVIESEDPANNNSVVLRLDYGEVSFLLTGDLQEEGEIYLLANRAEVESTVLKLAHHGSRFSNSRPFLEAVGADWAVVSAGYDNPFGHPSTVVLRRLKAMGVRIFRTDEMGTVEMTTDGHVIDVKWGRGLERKRDRLLVGAGELAALAAKE